MTALQNSIQHALTELPQNLQDALTSLNGKYHHLPADWVHKTCQRLALNHPALGLALLPLAAAFAEVPISNFKVGAVAFDSLGNAYLGANFEFTGVAINQTLHAEQSAIANAWSCGAPDLALLVINYAPCGHCRQFMNEVNLAANFQIQLPDDKPQSLAAYLPNAFGPNDLGISERILQRNLSKIQHNNDIKLAATHACQYSHAPYSNNHSGIAVVFEDNEIIVGCYGENAAFNPSLPPLQMALNSRRMQGKDWATITNAVMVESQPTISQKQQTEQLLAAISAPPLTYLPA